MVLAFFKFAKVNDLTDGSSEVSFAVDLVSIPFGDFDERSVRFFAAVAARVFDGSLALICFISADAFVSNSSCST